MTLEIRYLRRKLLAWYETNGRSYPWRNLNTSLYRQVIAEFLLQRTTATTVAWFYPGFVRKYPSWIKLSKASKKELQDTFKPIGLYKQRANSMHKLAKIIATNNGKIPRQAVEIKNLPGVGDYIANAIQLFQNEERLPLLDSNMARVFRRYFGIAPEKKGNIDLEIRTLAIQVLNTNRPIQLNWAILDYSSQVCHYQHPRCDDCVIQRHCKYNLSR